MIQEFTIEPFKIVQDEESYGIAVHKENNSWEVIASFKYPADAVSYFNNLVFNMEHIVNETDKK